MTYTKTLAVRWGETIREIRTELGLSLEAMAERTGIDAGHLSRGERGLAGFGDDYRVRIAAALGKRVEEIFTYSEAPCPSAAHARGAATSQTPATTAACPSPAPSAAAPGASGREGSHGNE